MNEDKFVVGARRLAEYDAMDQHELGVRMLTDFKTYVDWIHLQAFGCPFVFEDVHLKIMQALQDYADGKFKTRNLAINVMPGCVSGDTLVRINRGGKGIKCTIEHLYKMFNGGISGGKTWNRNTPTMIRKLVGNRVGLYKIEGVYYTGIKPVYELTLEDGKKIKCTADHQIMTDKGFCRLDELNIGDLVMVDNMMCSPSEHSKLHKCESNFGQGIPGYSAVVSVEYKGEEKVYDVDTGINWKTDGNFSANEIIVHNCGKTTIVQYWVSWCFARCRSSMFLYVNAVETVVKELSAHTRDLLLLPAWQKIYGVEIDNTRLSGAQTSKTRWSLKSGGLNSGLIAKTLSSTVLGLSAGNPNADGFPGCLLIDDPEGTDTITQEYQRNQVHSIYSQGLKSRRRGTKVGTVLIQQRLHIEDLTGWLNEVEADDPDDSWTVISVPALYQKEDGEWASSCSRVMSVSELETMREKDPYKFYSMYQQEPITLGGNYFHENDFRYYTELPEMQTTFVSTDFAFKKEENYDRTVFLHWGLGIDNKLYLLNWDLFREDVLGVKKRFVEFMKKCREQYPLLSTVVVEKSVANTAFLPDLVAEHPYFNFIPFSKSGMNNKVMFIKASREFFISEKVWFPKSPKPTDLIKETLMFSIEGTAPHDDAPDAMALGIHYIFSNLEMNSLFI